MRRQTSVFISGNHRQQRKARLNRCLTPPALHALTPTRKKPYQRKTHTFDAISTVSFWCSSGSTAKSPSFLATKCSTPPTEGTVLDLSAVRIPPLHGERTTKSSSLNHDEIIPNMLQSRGVAFSHSEWATEHSLLHGLGFCTNKRHVTVPQGRAVTRSTQHDAPTS